MEKNKKVVIVTSQNFHDAKTQSIFETSCTNCLKGVNKSVQVLFFNKKKDNARTLKEIKRQKPQIVVFNECCNATIKKMSEQFCSDTILCSIKSEHSIKKVEKIENLKTISLLLKEA